MGFDDPKCYESCPVHWSKIVNLHFTSCDNPIVTPINYFYVEMYLESQDEVKKFNVFKHQFAYITNNIKDDEIGSKLSEKEGKTCKVDFDKSDDIEASTMAALGKEPLPRECTIGTTRIGLCLGVPHT